MAHVKLVQRNETAFVAEGLLPRVEPATACRLEDIMMTFAAFLNPESEERQYFDNPAVC